MKKQRLLNLCAAIALTASPACAQSLLFEHSYGANGPDREGQAIVQLPDNGFMLAATIYAPQGVGAIQEDIQVIRTNSSGDTLWTRTYGATNAREAAERMALTPDGDIVIVGHTSAIPAGPRDAYLLCIDAQGNVLWSKTVGAAADNETATGVIALREHLLICGFNYSAAGNGGDAWLFKTDGTGNVLWQRTYGGSAYDEALDLELTPEGGCMLAGSTYSFAAGQQSDAWLIKTDTAGHMIWHKEYGLPDRLDRARALTPVRAGGQISGYAFTGVKNTDENLPGAQYGSLLLIRVDTAGTVVWDKSITGPSGDLKREGFDLAQLSTGEIVAAGRHSAPAGIELYLVRTDGGGNLLWDTSYSSQDAPISMADALCPTGDGGFAVTGYLLNATDGQLAFLSRYGRKSTSVSNVQGSRPFRVYPVPFKESFMLESGTAGSAELHNALGQQVHRQRIERGVNPVSLPGLPAGCYWLTTYDGRGVPYVTRLVKE